VSGLVEKVHSAYPYWTNLMARESASIDLVLPPRPPEAGAGRWLYGAIREAILAGRLPPGARLPATRDLAAQYALARGTVVQAFEELQGEGYLEARVGSGTRVSPTLPDSLLTLALPARRGGAAPVRRRTRPLSSFGRRLVPLRNLEPGPIRAFRANQPALDLFPMKLWAQIAGRRLRRAGADLLLSCPPLGYPPLRQAVADYLGAARGVACTAERVAIVSGVQEGMDLAARLLLDPGDRAAVENPGYDGARHVFEALGARVVAVPVDEEGMRVEPAALAGARLVYVTPAHQFPLGVGMSLARRLALLEWAAAAGAVIFEDDYDGEYRYSGHPLPALQGLDRHGQVLFAGSFSKVLFPSLRLGYVVVPDDLVERFAALLSITHRHAPLLAQAVLAEFIAEGYFGRHLRRMRAVYAERLGVLLEGAAQHLAGRLEISDVEAGLQTVGWLAPGLTAERAAAAAARRRVEVLPLDPTWHGRAPRQGLVLGFAAVAPPEIRRGVRDLAAALEREMRAH
jgi:GntR family transcriptional regulator / MocR family aminotransferase